MTIELKRNVPGFRDANGVFHPLRSASYIPSGNGRRKATVRDKKKYSRAKAGDLGKARQERALEDIFDREIRLEREAKEQLQKERDRIEREIAGDIYGESSGRTSRGKARSLVQYVRAQGGINTKFRLRRGQKQIGDLANYTLKDSGKRGLVTTTPGKGLGLDGMWQSAREAGYDVSSTDDLLARLDSEIAGGPVTYSTHGSMSYNPATKKNPGVAQTILQQLGGNKFMVMTGAKNLGHTANSLQFRLPANFATGGINFVRITLNGRDLYDVEFGKLRGVKYSVIKIDKDIYADMLRDLFTRRTGLDTSLGTMGRRNPAAKKGGMFELSQAKADAAEKSLSHPDRLAVVWKNERSNGRGSASYGFNFQPRTFRHHVGDKFNNQFSGNKEIGYTCQVAAIYDAGENVGKYTAIRNPAKVKLSAARLRELDYYVVNDPPSDLYIVKQLGTKGNLATFRSQAQALAFIRKIAAANEKQNPAGGGWMAHAFPKAAALAKNKNLNPRYTTTVFETKERALAVMLSAMNDLAPREGGRVSDFTIKAVKVNPAGVVPEGFFLEKGHYAGQFYVRRDGTNLILGMGSTKAEAIKDARANLAKRKSRTRKKNPDPVSTFASLAWGIASSLHIKEMLTKPTARKAAKRRGTTTAKTKKRTNPAWPSDVEHKVASSGSKAGLEKVLQQFYMSPSIRIEGNAAYNSKGIMTSLKLANKGSKWFAYFPKGKTNPAPSAKRSKGPKGDLYVLTIGSGDDLISVYLHDGDKDGFSKRFKTMAAAKAYATKSKVKLVSNPAAAKVNGIVSRAWARSRAKAEYARELRLAAAADRSRERRRKAEAKAKANPRQSAAGKKTVARAANGKKAVTRSAKVNPRVIQLPIGFHWKKRQAAGGGDYFEITDPKGLIVGWGTTRTNALRTFKTYGVKARAQSGFSKDRAKQIREGARSIRLPARKNPKSTARRRTFEMFQGRKATTAKAMPVSRHAPAKLDQLGDLVEIRLRGGKVIKFNPRKFKLTAARGKLWIVGGPVAPGDGSVPVHVVNPVAEIDHVVYGTRKPHHGDHAYTHYIHKLGEESGKRPILCVDREGFPVIRGGNYKIEARGIVD